MFIIQRINRKRVYDLLIYLLFIVLMVLTIKNKDNLYVDELGNYGMANNVGGTSIVIEDGKTYYPSAVPWMEYMTVDAEHRFDYKNVWKNQAEDVHPPLSYMFLHTICSIFPGIFSIWSAAVINIVFALGTLFFLRKIALLLVEDELIQRILSVTFVCSAGILSAVSFLRMYICAMFWVTAMSYFIIRQVGEAHKIKFYLTLIVCTVGGALTHYYCIVYAVLLSVVYGIWLLYKKRMKETVFFCLAQGTAGLLSVAIFPAMIQHIFSSGRGEESVGNLVGNSLGTWLMRLKIYFGILDDQLFGGVAVYIFFAALIVLFVYGRRQADRVWEGRQEIVAMRYLCIIVPCILYFILISRIAVFLSDRYMHPIYAVLYVTVLGALGKWLKRNVTEKFCVRIMAAILAVMTVNSWKNAEWEYLYKSTGALLNTAAAYEEVDCICVYEKIWEILPAYYEASRYHSITFFTADDLDMLASMDLSERYQMILMTSGDDENLIKRVLDICPDLNSSEYLGGFSYTNTYFLHAAH